MAIPVQLEAAQFGSQEPATKPHFSADVVRIILIIAVLILAMLMPYLPGRFDRSASTVSFLAQLGSLASLFLVLPVGVVWLLNRSRSHLWLTLARASARVIACALTIAAIAVNQLALGLILGVISLLALRTRRSRPLNSANVIDRSSRLPLYLVSIPIVLLVFRATALPIAAEWSRTRAIAHSAPLVREIELFRTRTGSYPSSLQSLNPDVPTGVMGVERFLYEPNGESYNVFFVRPSIQLDAQEVIMFNPRDEHRFTSHELDLLQHSGEQLDLRRGDRRRTPLSHRHWVSILFD